MVTKTFAEEFRAARHRYGYYQTLDSYVRLSLVDSEEVYMKVEVCPISKIYEATKKGNKGEYLAWYEENGKEKLDLIPWPKLDTKKYSSFIIDVEKVEVLEDKVAKSLI